MYGKKMANGKMPAKYADGSPGAVKAAGKTGGKGSNKGSMMSGGGCSPGTTGTGRRVMMVAKK